MTQLGGMFDIVRRDVNKAPLSVQRQVTEPPFSIFLKRVVGLDMEQHGLFYNRLTQMGLSSASLCLGSLFSN